MEVEEEMKKTINTPSPGNFMMMKKKKDGAAALLKDCANCGAPEGKVYGVTVLSLHRGITYYCSVICQKHHWKEAARSTAWRGGAERGNGGNGGKTMAAMRARAAAAVARMAKNRATRTTSAPSAGGPQ